VSPALKVPSSALSRTSALLAEKSAVDAPVSTSALPAQMASRWAPQNASPVLLNSGLRMMSVSRAVKAV